MAAQGKRTELEIDGSRALKEFQEQNGDHKTDNDNQENIINDRPSAGREARQTAIERNNRDFDQTDRHPEDHYAIESKLDESAKISAFFPFQHHFKGAKISCPGALLSQRRLRTE